MICGRLTLLTVAVLAGFTLLSGCDNAASKQGGLALEKMAVQDTLNAYTAAVTRHDFDGIVELYTPDATWEARNTPFDLKFGGDGLRAGFENAIGMARDLVQINTPATISIDGDSATAKSMIYEFGDMADGSAHVTSQGIYDDTFVKVDGAWKFKARVFTAYQIWSLPYAKDEAAE